MTNDRVVIVGAGQSGYQSAASLRQAGFSGPISLIGDEPDLPYQRPPLSKSFMDGSCEPAQLTFQGADFYRDHRIDLVLGTRVIGIDRPNQQISMSDQKALSYRRLILSLGARARTLPNVPTGVAGISTLRTIRDAQALRGALCEARHVVVVGGSFLGLEFSAIAAAEGKVVTVIEATPRLMSRAVSTTVAEVFKNHHESNGVRFRFGDEITEFGAANGKIVSVTTKSGETMSADLVVACIGVIPNVDLAKTAGLHIDNGIVVDQFLRTSDPAIYALGDCASFFSRFSPHRCRLESVQNSSDHARHIAAHLSGGHVTPFDAVPWFWSHQAGLKLQIAGLNHEVDTVISVGNVDARRFSVLGFRRNRLVAVESVDSPGDHMHARRLLARAEAIFRDDVPDTLASLREIKI